MSPSIRRVCRCGHGFTTDPADSRQTCIECTLSEREHVSLLHPPPTPKGNPDYVMSMIEPDKEIERSVDDRLVDGFGLANSGREVEP
jgi:hypothetical protein